MLESTKQKGGFDPLSFKKKKGQGVVMCKNFSTLVLGQFPLVSYIISNFCLYLEKVVVLV
jgi:hypothetical protein